MASSENQAPKPRTKQLTKIAKEEIERDIFSNGSADSGLGSMSSILSSDYTSSYTDSASLNDQSRNQECDSTSDLIKETEQLKIDNVDSGKPLSILSTDDGYRSLLSSELLKESPRIIDSRLVNYHATGQDAKIFDYVRNFAQTKDVRYILAPLRFHLLDQNDDGDTSLHLAIINGNVDVILSIMDVLPTSKCFDIYNDLTQTPLHLAVITRQSKIVGKLIDYGANVDLVDRNGQTCVHLACQHGHLESLRAIFKPRPAQRELREKLQEILETRNFDGLTPLCVAVRAKNVEIVKELIMLNVNVNAIDTKSGNTALHLAVEDNNLPMISCLLFQGKADPNAMSYTGNTPLHVAAGLQLNAIIATLIAIGANASIENLEGDTAFKVASESCEDISDKEFEIARESFDSSDDEMEN